MFASWREVPPLPIREAACADDEVIGNERLAAGAGVGYGPRLGVPRRNGVPGGSRVTRVDLVTLSLFIAVVEETSLAKAAEREHLAPSAISKRLQDLELNLNVKLFERKPTGMFPTAAGTALLHHARLIMRNVSELETELVDFAGGVRGTI